MGFRGDRNRAWGPSTDPEVTGDTIMIVLKAISRSTDMVFGDDMPSRYQQRCLGLTA